MRHITIVLGESIVLHRFGNITTDNGLLATG